MQCYLLRQSMPVFKCYSWPTLSCFIFIWEKVKVQKVYSSKRPYAFFCDHIVSIDDFKILVTRHSDFHVKVKESILISRDEPILSKNETSLPIWLIPPIQNYILMIFIFRWYLMIFWWCYNYSINIRIVS